MKDLFNLWADDFFSFPSIKSLMPKNVEAKTEVYKVGNYKTEVTTYFSKDGRLLGTSTNSKFVPSKEEESINEKTLELKQAVEQEDYLLANKLKQEITELEQKIKQLA